MIHHLILEAFAWVHWFRCRRRVAADGQAELRGGCAHGCAMARQAWGTDRAGDQPTRTSRERIESGLLAVAARQWRLVGAVGIESTAFPV